MATTQIAISPTAWTLVAAAETNGYITANSALPVLFGVFASLPAANTEVGHAIPLNGFNFSVGTGEALYAKARSTGATVTVTINTAVSP
jgi:hypothetical protein